MQRPILPIDFWKTLKPAGRSPAGARKAIPGRLHLLVPQLEIHQHAASIHYRRTAGGPGNRHSWFYDKAATRKTYAGPLCFPFQRH